MDQTVKQVVNAILCANTVEWAAWSFMAIMFLSWLAATIIPKAGKEWLLDRYVNAVQGLPGRSLFLWFVRPARF